MGSAPSVLSIVSRTSARPSGGREEVPAKMTSSILPPRSDLAPCSPMTHARASTTLDLPEPLGPTTAVMPGSKRSVVEDAKDLKPRRVRLFKYKRLPILSGAAPHGSPRGLASANDTGRGRPDRYLTSPNVPRSFAMRGLSGRTAPAGGPPARRRGNAARGNSPG